LRIIHKNHQNLHDILRLNSKTLNNPLAAFFKSGIFESKLNDMECKSEINDMLGINMLGQLKKNIPPMWKPENGIKSIFPICSIPNLRHMKKITLLLLLTINLSYSQTREETVDWLNRYLDEYYSAGWGETYNIEIKKDDLGNDYIGIKVFYKPLGTNSFYAFKADAISRVSTTRKLRSDKVNGNLDIEIVSKDKRIWTDKEEFIESIILSVQTSDEISERIKKGFLHLLNLMGNDSDEEKEFFKN